MTWMSGPSAPAAVRTSFDSGSLFGTSDSYVRAVRQRTSMDGFPRLTAADIAWHFNRWQYFRQKSKEHYWRRKAAKENGDA